MIIYPAIDLRNGKVVRLKEGKPDQQTVFSHEPLTIAQRWLDEGAEWLHVVNLDGAFADDYTANNERILAEIAKLNTKIQFGGGLRTMDAINRAFDLGVSRVVLGTAAITQPEIVDQALAAFGAERLCIALDAKDGKIATHGWQQTSEVTPLEYGRSLARKGILHALYTDVHRDGSLFRVNVHDTILLGRDTGLQVIASGGVSSMEEIHQLARSQVVAGAVIGMALYEGQLSIAEALLAARSGNAG